MGRAEHMLHQAARHGAPLRLGYKLEHRWTRLVGRLLRPILPEFMDRTATVVGGVIYLPLRRGALPDDLIARVVAHEWVHRRDMLAFGPLFYLSYALLLPVGWTARAHWERRAYAVELMLAWEEGGEQRLAATEAELVTFFAGSSYLWMCPGRRRAQRCLAPVSQQIRAGTLQETIPYRHILAAWRGSR
ncbi:MAG: hypothetical protein JXX28_09260 [Deltaproteobacteria bacterium]|nr:hypothetical protein [Deltaproteobacteria bacterium]